MKKLLALVLALVMSMSLVTISNAAYSDKADIDLKEAVDVLSAVGVFEGSDGKFDPKANLTREQAAKLVAYLQLGKKSADALVGGNKFTDVAANRWSAGYVDYCATTGIVAGVGNGQFDPAGSLTALQFGKMLLICLGYDAKAEGLTGSDWQINASKLMASANLLKGLDTVTANSVVTREQAAQMMLNALKAPMVEYSTKGSTISVNGAVIDLGGSKATYVVGKDNSVWNIGKDSTNDGTKYGIIELGEKLYTDLKLRTSTSDAFERPTHEWYLKATKIGAYADKADLTYTAEVKFGTIYADLGLSKSIAIADIAYYVDGARQSAVPHDIYKGNTTNSFGGNGVLTEVFYNADNHTVVVTETNTYLGKVTAAYAASSAKDAYISIAAKTGTSGDFTTDDAYKAGDFVTFTYSYKTGENCVESVAAAEKVVGDLTAYTVGKSVNIGTTTYKANNVAGSKATIVSGLQNAMNTECTVYLDQYGYALWVDATAASDAYAVIIGVNSVGAGAGTMTSVDKAELLLLDGTRKVVSLSDDTSIAAANLYDVVTYKINSKGIYNLTVVAEAKAEKMNSTADKNLVIKGTTQLTNAASGNLTYGIKGNALVPADTDKTGDLYANGKTVFLFWNPTTKTVSRYVGIANVPTFAVKANEDVTYAAYSAGATANFYAKVFFGIVDTNCTLSSTSKDVIFIKGNADDESHNDALNDYYTYDAIVNGEITKINTSAKVSGYTLVTGLSKNSDDVYDTTAAAGGLQLGTNAVAPGTASATNLVYTKGTDAVSNGTIKLGPNYVSVADDCKVFRISHDKKEIFASSVDSIQLDTNDTVWYKVTDGEVTTIVIQIVDNYGGDVVAPADIYSYQVDTTTNQVNLVYSSATSTKAEAAAKSDAGYALQQAGYVVKAWSTDGTAYAAYLTDATLTNTHLVVDAYDKDNHVVTFNVYMAKNV